MRIPGSIKLSGRFRRELLKYLKRLRNELGVSEVILFGSRVYGCPLLDSDLDMVVVSSRFESTPFLKRMEMLSKLWDGNYTLEQFPYTPEEINRYLNRKVVVTEACKKGVRLKLP